MTEAKLYLESQMNAAAEHAVAGGCAAVFSTRCPGKETPNEDAVAVFLIDESSAVLAVADGMGGGPSGERAAALALTTLCDALQSVAGSSEQLRTAILDGIDAANRKIQNVAPESATTLAVLEIQGQRVRPYHIGDSMILTVGFRGQLKWQTVSHSPVGYAVEAGVLDEAEAMHHEDRHVVSNIVGSPNMRVEMGPVLKLRPRDTVLLASDGLSDNLHTEEIVARLCKGDLKTAVDHLAGNALERMTQSSAAQIPSKPDDLTIVAFRPTLP